MHDIGLTERGIWSFYLSKNELIYSGISEDYINNILTYEQELDEDNEIEIE